MQATGATLQPQLTENFGFEAWAKSTTTSGRHWLLYNGNLGGDGWGLFQDGASYFVYCAGRVQFGGGTVTTEQWTHLAVVRVNGLTTLYVNGDAVASSTIPPNPPGGSFAAGAHQGNPGGGERWVGAIDEIRYFTFPPGEFMPGDLLLRKPEIQIVQAEGPEIFDGGTRDFGAMPVGSSATAGFTIHSVGNLDLTGFQPTLEGSDAAEFTLTAPETSAMAPRCQQDLYGALRSGERGDQERGAAPEHQRPRRESLRHQSERRGDGPGDRSPAAGLGAGPGWRQPAVRQAAVRQPADPAFRDPEYRERALEPHGHAAGGHHRA